MLSNTIGLSGQMTMVSGLVELSAAAMRCFSSRNVPTFEPLSQVVVGTKLTDGETEGVALGWGVGLADGVLEGDALGLADGMPVGLALGLLEGDELGLELGLSDARGMGYQSASGFVLDIPLAKIRHRVLSSPGPSRNLTMTSSSM